MQYSNEEPQCEFSVPDEPTVRQQLVYLGAVAGSGNDWVVKRWLAAKPLITEWKCSIAPDLDAIDIDKETRRDVAILLGWVATQVLNHMSNVEKVEKK